ncbi:MAG: ABC transporter ATP-binding protein [Candidatus Kariarchaeaceae archaeon]|jgi:ABC-type lipoprotein export system ATPase subunit
MAIREKKKSVGQYMAATLVDWNQSDQVHKMQKKIKKSLNKTLKTSKVQNNRINTFSVSIADIYKLPRVGRSLDRLSTESKTQEIFAEYAKSINEHYRKELKYNGDSHIYISALKSLGFKDLSEELPRVQHSVIDKIEEKISEIVSNASIGIWDLPGTNEDRIILPNLVAKFGNEHSNLELSSIIDELLVANLARNFLPFSKKILEEAVVEFTQLKVLVSRCEDNTKISPGMKTVLRNFIGSISGLQESAKLFDREVAKIYQTAVESFDYLKELPSTELKKWATIKNRAIGIEIKDLIHTLNYLISDIKPVLRKMLREEGDNEISNYHGLMSCFVKIKAQIMGIKHWVHRFEDLPSFTTLENGIAYEEVDGETYQPVSSDAMIEGTKLFKLYHRGTSSIYALRGVDLSIKQGEFVVIRGPSGAGKTTLLNILAGLDYSGRGTVFYNGVDMKGLKERARSKIRRENFSFIFQTYALIPHLTAYENTKIPLDLTKFSKELAQDIQKLLDSVGIGEFSDHKPALLSGGQMQRLGIARALVNKPKVIFADEPTGDLDEATSLIVMDLIKKYHEETGVTIILVTHDEKIAKYATREIFLQDGQIESEIVE